MDVCQAWGLDIAEWPTLPRDRRKWLLAHHVRTQEPRTRAMREEEAEQRRRAERSRELRELAARSAPPPRRGRR